jgi:hypothetical protein
MAINWNKGTGMCDFYANKFTGVKRYESSEPQNDVALMYRSCQNLDGKFHPLDIQQHLQLRC